MATLRLLPASGPVIEVTQDPTVVGRDPGCDIVLADGSVSRHHARLEQRVDGWAVVDLNSANGTFIDSVRVGEAGLQPGREVRFGAVSFKVELPAEKEDLNLETTMDGSETAPEIVAPAPPIAMPAPPPAAAPARPAPAVPPPPPPPKAASPPPPPPAPPRPAPPRASRPVSPAGPPAPPLRQGRGPFFWIGIGCSGCLVVTIAAIGLILGVFYFLTQGAADVVERQLAEIRRGEMDKAYGRLSESMRARMSPKDFELLVASHPTLKYNVGSRFWSRSVNNETAHLSGVLSSVTEGSEPVAYDLVREAGGWRISAIRFGNEVATPKAPSPPP